MREENDWNWPRVLMRWICPRSSGQTVAWPAANKIMFQEEPASLGTAVALSTRVVTHFQTVGDEPRPFVLANTIGLDFSSCYSEWKTVNIIAIVLDECTVSILLLWIIFPSLISGQFVYISCLWHAYLLQASQKRTITLLCISKFFHTSSYRYEGSRKRYLAWISTTTPHCRVLFYPGATPHEFLAIFPKNIPFLSRYSVYPATLTQPEWIWPRVKYP